LQPLNVGAGEHGVRRAAGVPLLDLAIGADQHVVQFQGAFAIRLIGKGLRGGDEGKGEGEARKGHFLYNQAV
jgi:hypothetical protein